MTKTLTVLAALAMTLVTTTLHAEKYHAYFGTYGDHVYVATFDSKTGELGEAKPAGEVKRPSFLAVHPTEKYLYAVGEVSNFGGKKVGGVTAFAIDEQTGMLKKLNAESSGGAGPCHLVVDPTGKNVLVANYGGGSVAVLPIGADGKLAEASSFVQHEGSSVNPARQKGPHAHSINVDAGNRFAFAADLGLDKVLVYRFDPKTGKLTANDPAFAMTNPGGGPRHFAFHPNGKYAYANLEMTLEVTTFEYDAKKGTLTELQTISTLPEDVTDLKGLSTAETRVHPSGKYVFVSNRGHDTIAMFFVDDKSGTLIPIGHTSTGGKTPRNFNIDPSGNFILAANQTSGNVVVLKIDTKRDELKPTGREIKVPAPVCVRFVPVK